MSRVNMPYKRLCLAGVLFPFTIWAAVFGTIRGVVHDPDHRPVQRAQVVLKSSSFGLLPNAHDRS